MSKVVGMLVAVAMFFALPAVASAQTPQPGGNGNTVNNNNQTGGTINAGGGSQNIQQQGIAGRDVNQSAVNSQIGVSRGVGVSGVRGVGTRGVGVSGVGTRGVGVGGGVTSVGLARTGFDAWILALVGGVAIAGGLGLLAAQRRGLLSS